MKKADRRRPPRSTQRIQTAEPDHLIGDIVGVVPTSAWAFARIDHHGALIAPSGSPMTVAGVAALDAEYRCQRAVVPMGPRIAATMHAFPGSVAGVSILFADARSDYGIIVLLRDATLPNFSSVEIGILTFSLAAGTDCLAALRLQPAVAEVTQISRHVIAAEPAPYGEAFYVLDRDLEIVLASDAEGRRTASSAPDSFAERLPPLLERSVRERTASWLESAVKEPGIARPVSFLVLRTLPLSGRAGEFVGVRIDRFRPANSLTGAATRFDISPREVQVLALLLDGDHLDQIAYRMHITSSTVQDHIKSMLDKTESRNRSELIARILGWESPPNPSAPL